MQRPTKAALKLSIPVLAVYLPVGFIYGLLFTHAGYPWYWAPIASLIIYGGSLQFPMLAVIASGGSPLSVALMAAGASVRFLFYGPSLIHRFTGSRWERAYLAFGLVDATYSILINHDEFEGEDDRKFIWFLTASTHAYWVTSTFIGALVGTVVSIEIPGLEFTLTALLVVLTCEQYRRIKDPAPSCLAERPLSWLFLSSPPSWCSAA